MPPERRRISRSASLHRLQSDRSMSLGVEEPEKRRKHRSASLQCGSSDEKRSSASKTEKDSEKPRRPRMRRSNSLRCAASNFQEALKASTRHYKESKEANGFMTSDRPALKAHKSSAEVIMRLSEATEATPPPISRSRSDDLTKLSQSLHVGRSQSMVMSGGMDLKDSLSQTLHGGRSRGGSMLGSLSQSMHVQRSQSIAYAYSSSNSSRLSNPLFERDLIGRRGSLTRSQNRRQSLGMMGSSSGSFQRKPEPTDDSLSFLTCAVELRRRKHYEKCSKSAVTIQRIARGWLVRYIIADGQEKPDKITSRRKSHTKKNSQKDQGPEKRSVLRTKSYSSRIELDGLSLTALTSHTRQHRSRPSLLKRTDAVQLPAKDNAAITLSNDENLEENLCAMFRSNIAGAAARARRRSCYGRIDGLCA